LEASLSRLSESGRIPIFQTISKNAEKRDGRMRARQTSLKWRENIWKYLKLSWKSTTYVGSSDLAFSLLLSPLKPGLNFYFSFHALLPKTFCVVEFT